MPKIFLTTALLGCALATAAAAQDRAGIAYKVQANAFQATTGVGLEVATNDDIFQNARVYTKQYGSMDIRLDDGTNLTVAPNASLVIDEYVFRGSATPGSLAMSLSRGAMRMVSGRMPKEGYAVTTPVASIGVRGTTLWLDAADPTELRIWTEEGVVVARPVQSDVEFVFNAPAFATCTATACVEGAIPPVPVSYPSDPTGRQTGDFGFDPNDSPSALP